MKKEQIISWIFLAIKIASNEEPASYDGIVLAADYINKSIPSHNEMDMALSWLKEYELVNSQNVNYSLSSKGDILYEEVINGGKSFQKIMENLERKIKNNYV